MKGDPYAWQPPGENPADRLRPIAPRPMDHAAMAADLERRAALHKPGTFARTTLRGYAAQHRAALA